MNRTIKIFTDVPQTWMPCELVRLPTDHSPEFAHGIPGCWRFVLSGKCDPGPSPWRSHLASDAQLLAGLLSALAARREEIRPRIWLFAPSVSQQDAESICGSLACAAIVPDRAEHAHHAADGKHRAVQLLARVASPAELVTSGWHGAFLRYLPTFFSVFSSEASAAEQSLEDFCENTSHERPNRLPASPYAPEAFAAILDEADYVAQCWDFDSPEVLIYSRRLPAQAAMDAIREIAKRAEWEVEVERLEEHRYFDWLTQRVSV